MLIYKVIYFFCRTVLPLLSAAKDLGEMSASGQRGSLQFFINHRIDQRLPNLIFFCRGVQSICCHQRRAEQATDRLELERAIWRIESDITKRDKLLDRRRRRYADAAAALSESLIRSGLPSLDARIREVIRPPATPSPETCYGTSSGLGAAAIACH